MEREAPANAAFKENVWPTGSTFAKMIQAAFR